MMKYLLIIFQLVNYHSSYSEGVSDGLIAIHGSNGTVEIAINQGNAAAAGIKYYPVLK